MEPAQICLTYLGRDKLALVIGELSTAQAKAVLREADFKPKSGSGFVSQKEKRRQWTDKIIAAIEAENDDHVASHLLQQWLLFHRRALLIDYLNALEVKHQNGETDENFLIDRDPGKLRSAAEKLLAQHDHQEVATYLLYIAHQQKAPVFDDWDALKAINS